MIFCAAAIASSAPVASAPRVFGPPFAAGAAMAANCCTSYDSGSPGLVSGEYARYSLPDLILQETSVADGVGSPVAFGRGGQPYFVDEGSVGFGLFGIPAGTGAQPGVEEFSGIPCAAASLATGPTGNVFVVQYCSNSVLEYTAKSVAGGGSKKPIATYTGGNLSPSGVVHPTAAVVDKAGGLYIGDNGGGVTYFAKGSKTATIAYPTGTAGYVNQMVADKKGDVWSIHGPNTTKVYFQNETQCVLDPSGTVVRYKLAERFSGGTLAQELYTATSDGPDNGSDGTSIAVDSKLRVYAGVGAPSDSVVLDYDPGASCPNDALSILGVKGQDPQIAVDAKKNFYVTDYVDNTISAYREGSTSLINQITQQSGLINLLYAAIE